ncbi:hypothetical protein MKEN_00461600 [Mycena kentingensis (nom. inval.)]|nr:hypothetical protein MKEN_00461600 [Mycena kentingensis (nom. inval.)]
MRHQTLLTLLVSVHSCFVCTAGLGVSLPQSPNHSESWLFNLKHNQIFLPLYAYPDDGCGAWSSVNNAISSYPSLPWYILVNPKNGPGPTDTKYQDCVAGLPAAAIRVVMGYIDTTTAKDTPINSQIDTYAAWAREARPTGIYLDVLDATSENLGMYAGYAAHAKSRGLSFIGLGVGKAASAEYLALGDLVTTVEEKYSAFDSDASSLSGNISKQAVFLHDAPQSGGYTDTIAGLQKSGAAAVYLTELPITSDAVPDILDNFVREVDSQLSVAASASAASTSSRSSSAASSSAPSSSSSATAQPLPSSDSAAKRHRTIIGGALGGVAALVLLLLGMVLCLLRRRRGKPSRSGRIESGSIAAFTDARSSVSPAPQGKIKDGGWSRAFPFAANSQRQYYHA